MGELENIHWRMARRQRIVKETEAISPGEEKVYMGVNGWLQIFEEPTLGRSGHLWESEEQLREAAGGGFHVNGRQNFLTRREVGSGEANSSPIGTVRETWTVMCCTLDSASEKKLNSGNFWGPSYQHTGYLCWIYRHVTNLKNLNAKRELKGHLIQQPIWLLSSLSERLTKWSGTVKPTQTKPESTSSPWGYWVSSYFSPG